MVQLKEKPKLTLAEIEARFNSSMVQLKAEIARVVRPDYLFQFLYGTIKRLTPWAAGQVVGCFNSSMVQLKELDPGCCPRGIAVSIPLWYN